MKKGWFIGSVLIIVVVWQLIVVLFEFPRPVLNYLTDNIQFEATNNLISDLKSGALSEINALNPLFQGQKKISYNLNANSNGNKNIDSLMFKASATMLPGMDHSFSTSIYPRVWFSSAY